MHRVSTAHLRMIDNPENRVNRVKKSRKGFGGRPRGDAMHRVSTSNLRMIDNHLIMLQTLFTVRYVTS
jgi:hypothetical protein